MNLLIDYFLEIFSATCIQFIPWIAGIVMLYVVIRITSSLLFKE